jgi:hypothetical protein
MAPIVISSLQLSGVTSINLWQPTAPKCLLLASVNYTLMRSMGPNTLLVAGLNISLWHVSSSSCQLFCVTYALQLTTRQLLTTHLVLTMQPGGRYMYSTAVKGLLTYQVPCLTAPLEPQYHQVAVMAVYTYSSFVCCSTHSSYTQGYLQLPACASSSSQQQRPLLLNTYSYTQDSLQPTCAFKQQLSHAPSGAQDLQGSSKGQSSCGVQDSTAAAVQRPSMRMAIKCAVLGLVNSVMNHMMVGVCESVIRGVDFWS